MKYHNDTIFTKYKIEPNIEIPKLMLLFQTDPMKRRDLPLVVGIIKSNEKLFEEELFTKRSNVENLSHSLLTHYNLLVSLEKLDINNEESLTTFENNYNNFNKADYKEFFYSKNLSEKNIKEIVKQFLNSILDELISKSFDTLEEKNTKGIIWLVKFLEKNNKIYLEKLEEIIAVKIEAVFSKIENKDYLKQNMNFICSLPLEFMHKTTIYKSYVYYIEKSFVKNDDIEFVNEYFIPLFSVLKEKEANHNSNVLINIAHKIVNLEEKKEDYSFVKKQAELLVNNYIDFILKYKNYKKEFDEEEFLMCIELLEGFCNSYDDYEEYYNKLENLKEDDSARNVYDFVEQIRKMGFSKNTYKIFGNLLIKLTDFNQTIQLWVRKNEALDKMITDFNGKIDIITYDAIKSNVLIFGIINTPKFIDDLLCKYYSLYFFNNEILNQTAIDNLIASAFSITRFIDCADKHVMNNTNTYGSLTYTGMFIRDVLVNSPSDWYFGEETVESFLRYRLGIYYKSEYGESEFSKYKEKYEKLFKKKYKSTCEYVERINNIDDLIEQYEEAVKLYKNEEYEEAYDIFLEIPNIKDSKMYAEKSLEFINDNNYKTACELYEKEEYIEAISMFNELKQNSKYEESSNEYIRKSREKIYEDAMKLLNEEKYQKALEKFNKIIDYNDSRDKIYYCSEKIIELKNMKKYNDAENCIKKYLENQKNNENELEKAMDLYEKLAEINFLDSKNKLEECNQIVLDIKKQKERKKKIRILIFDIVTIVILILLVLIGFNIKKEGEPKYNDLIRYIGNYSGTVSENDQINNLLNELPSYYKEVKTIKEEFKTIKESARRISKQSRLDLSVSNSADIRYELKRIYSIDKNSELWDCTLYYQKVPLDVVVFGTSWYALNYKIRWYSDSDGHSINYNLPISDMDYFDTSFDKESNTMIFLGKKGNEEWKFLELTNLSYNNNRLCVKAYLNETMETTTFCD